MNCDLERLKDRLAEAEELLAEFVIEKRREARRADNEGGTAFKENV